MRLCIDRDFSLSAMFTREARLDTLNLHIYLGKKEGKYVEDLIKLREARYLIWLTYFKKHLTNLKVN